MNRGRPCWAPVLNTTLEKAQLPECINLNATLPIHKEKNFTTEIKEKLHKEEELRIINEIQMCGPETKLRTYKLFKTTSGMEPYLISNPRLSYIHTIARFRISSHTLEIETGRHRRPKVPVEERTCKICESNSVEDEQHFLRECLAPEIVQLRKKLIATAITCIPNYTNLNNRDKFNEILTNRESEMISALGSYLTLAFQKRYQLLSIPNN